MKALSLIGMLVGHAVFWLWIISGLEGDRNGWMTACIAMLALPVVFAFQFIYLEVWER